MDMNRQEDNILHDYIGKEMIGSEFNHVFNNINFLKLTNGIEKSSGLKIHDGLNIYTEGHDDGFWFVDKNKAYMTILDRAYCENMKYKYMRKVIIPNDATVYIAEDYFITDKIFLGKRKLISKDIFVQ